MALAHTRAGHAMSGFLDPNFMYATYTTRDGNGWAVRWDSINDTYQTIDLSTVASNHMELPLRDPLDDHYQLRPGVDDQDKVFIKGNHRINQSDWPTTTHMVVCNDVANFSNPASWAAASTSHADNLLADPSHKRVYTYDNFDRMSDGTLLHFLSQADTNGEPKGRDILGFKRRAGVWSAITGDGHFITTENVADEHSANAAYFNGLVIVPNYAGGSTDGVFITGNFRSTAGDTATGKQPFLLYSVHANLATWRYFTSAFPGYATQSMPLTWANRSNAVATSAPATSSTFRESVYVDSFGSPSFIARDGTTSDFVRLTWNVVLSQWESAAVAAQSGEHFDFRLHGERWVRQQLTLATAIRRVSDSRNVRIGGQVPSSGSNFSPTPDPVWLRTRGVYCICVPDGDTPKFWTFGNTARTRNT